MLDIYLQLSRRCNLVSVTSLELMAFGIESTNLE